MKRFTKFSNIILLLILVSLIFIAAILYSKDQEKIEFKTDDRYLADFPQDYRIVQPPVPLEMEFAGERVPLENIEVHEMLEREMIVNTYFHSSTLTNLKRTTRWFPVIEPILEKYGIPEDFKYVAVIESNLDNVVSPANARGFWQFREAAAEEYGLEVNREVDERYHVEKATEAAAKYLLKSYAKFSSWTLAASSYNVGISGIATQLELQKADNYYKLVLGDEAARYIFRILAWKQLSTNPEKYGFDLDEKDYYKPFETYEIKVDSSITHLADFSAENGIDYKTLKLLNPWLRYNYLENDRKKTYSIKLPEPGTIKLIKESYYKP